MRRTMMMARTEHQNQLVREINEWKEKRNAILLAHNYQIPEIQDIADVLGDSLALARAAEEATADVIVFCGVHFMAETAAILSPEKTVLLPDLGAGCSLADSITAAQLRAWKKEHPNAVVVSYVNTSADVKAESDYCCTSSNAVEIVQSIPEEQEILFLPDMFLGDFVQRETGRKNMHIWMGECHVHAGIEADEFIVATEVGIMHQMQKQNPNKKFMAANPQAVCPFMKMINLDNVLTALKKNKHIITVPDETARKAKLAIDRMVAVG